MLHVTRISRQHSGWTWVIEAHHSHTIAGHADLPHELFTEIPGTIEYLWHLLYGPNHDQLMNCLKNVRTREDQLAYQYALRFANISRDTMYDLLSRNN